jgi:hypothetical protein
VLPISRSTCYLSTRLFSLRSFAGVQPPPRPRPPDLGGCPFPKAAPRPILQRRGDPRLHDHGGRSYVSSRSNTTRCVRERDAPHESRGPARAKNHHRRRRLVFVVERRYQDGQQCPVQASGTEAPCPKEFGEAQFHISYRSSCCTFGLRGAPCMTQASSQQRSELIASSSSRRFHLTFLASAVVPNVATKLFYSERRSLSMKHRVAVRTHRA